MLVMLLNFTMVATCLIGLTLPGPGVAFNADSDPTWLAIDSLEEQDCGKELGQPCRQYANVKVCSEQVNGKCMDGKSETVSSAARGQLQFDAQTQSSGGDWATIGKGAHRTLQVPWNQGLQKQMDNGKYHAVLRRLNSVFRAMADQSIDVDINEKDQTFQDTMAKAHAKVGDVIRNLKLPNGINIVTPPLGYTHKSPAGNLSKGYAYLSHTPTQMPENPGKGDMYKITVQHVDCDFIKSSEKSAKNTNDRENFITNMNTAFAREWCNVAKSCLPPGVMKKYIDIVADPHVQTRLNSANCTQGSDTDCTDACTKSAKKNKQEEACFCLDPDTDLPVV